MISASGQTEPQWSVGSQWLRWDPHLHAPGTLRNDQFGNDWDSYIIAIESAAPPPCALGITDYFTLRSYKRIVELRERGRLGRVDLVFPNIEIRLTVETRRGQGINLHLLVCPDDRDHVARIEAMLASLQFRFRDQTFRCNDDDLRRLGRLYKDRPDLSDDAALSEGANQFKISMDDLRKVRNNEIWVQRNVLFCIAAGEDGLSGISKDASFAAERENLARFAQIIFSSTPSDRKYWSGQHPNFASSAQRPKPCLHGSDAHELGRVLNPDAGRLCWIRAEPTFDGLRQTLAEPSRRVHIGPSAPEGPSPTNVIRSITFKNADWARTSCIELNDGLVTIIGAKGSGKTALADLIAFAAHAEDPKPGSASFVLKADKLLKNMEVEVHWGDGTRCASRYPRQAGDLSEPRVRYLSQQFVERLCSTGGLSEDLATEVASIVFSAIPDDKRLACTSFQDLRDLRLRGILAERAAERETIRQNTLAVAHDLDLRKNLLATKSKAAEAQRAREALERSILLIPASANQQVVTEHQSVSSKLTTLREGIASEERTATLLQNLAVEIQRGQDQADRMLATQKREYGELLTDRQWELLRLRPDPEAQATLERLLRACRERASALRARGTCLGGEVDARGQGLDTLIAEEKRLSDALGADKANVLRRVEITKQLGVARKAEEQEKGRLGHAEGAANRMREAKQARLEAYQRLFATVISEQEILEELYAPLEAKFPEGCKLRFFVHRRVDLDSWASAGERLFDLRRPPFAGRGSLAEFAQADLVGKWQSGSPQEVRGSMESFISQHASAALDARVTGVTPADFGDWLFSTDHIGIDFGIKYEDVPLSHLSPGTRGVVLMTLYLGLDDRDTRPLVIDQPEENLDPRSVYADLVPFFRRAATRRQIIMVTHNANLVVTTDSDQVVVAKSERRTPNNIPDITYTSGGLESPRVRQQVCALLEGGEDAFRKRGERYGVGTDRV